MKTANAGSTKRQQSSVDAPWTASWNWLPGYIGGNGPILAVTAGSGNYASSLYIGGAFNNFGGIVQWTPGSSNGSNVVSVGPAALIEGLVTTIVQAQLQFIGLPDQTPTERPTLVPNPYPSPAAQDDTWLILLSCVLSGIILGVGFALGCYSNVLLLLLSNFVNYS